MNTASLALGVLGMAVSGGVGVLCGQRRVGRFVPDLLPSPGAAAPRRRLAPSGAFRAERDFARVLFDEGMTLINVVDREGRILRFNRACEELSGYAEAEMIGRTLWERLIPDDEVPRVAALFERLGAGDVPRQSQNDWICRDGTRRRISWSNAVITDTDGSVEFIVGLGLDVTDSHAIAERHRQVVELTSEGLVLVDADGRITVANPSYAGMLGYRPDELLGMDARSLVALPDQAQLDDLVTTRDRGLTRARLVRYVHRDGRTVSTRVVSTAIIGPDGSFHGLVALVRDMTSELALEAQRSAMVERFERLRDSLPGAVFEIDRRGELLFVSDGWEALTGLPTSAALGSGWLDSVHPDDRAALQAAGAAVVRAGTPADLRYRMVTPKGTIWVSNRVNALRDAGGTIVGAIGVVLDETAIVEAGQQAERFASVINASSDLVVIYRPDGTIVQVSDSAARVLALVPGAGGGIERVLDPASQVAYQHAVLPQVLQDGRWHGELTMTVDGRDLPVSATFIADLDGHGGCRQLSVIARDITDLRAAQATLARQARADQLTGLPNRRHLAETLDEVLAFPQADAALLFIDLDGFKSVNDAYGHDAGDELLVKVSDRLVESVRPHDTVTRLGGDEFVVILRGVDGDAARRVGQRILDRMRSPFHLGAGTISIGASIGIHCADTADTPSTALIAADQAMYLAKQSGKNAISFSTASR